MKYSAAETIARKLSAALWLTAAGLFGTSLEARADTVVIGPSADATIFEEGTEFANGSGPRLFVGATNDGYARRTLITFDVSAAVPVQSDIHRVELRLRVARTVADDMPVSLHTVTTPWTEGPAPGRGSGGGQGTAARRRDSTWIYASFNGALWSSPGGDYLPEPRASTIAGQTEEDVVWTSDGMLADIETWVSDPDSNHGWVLIGREDSPTTTKAFHSRQPDLEGIEPLLTIEFTPPPGAGACCQASGRCTVGTAETCGETFQGEGAQCFPNPCPQPTGACCLPTADALCEAGTREDCDAAEGVYLGTEAMCDPNPCHPILEPYVDELPTLRTAVPTSTLGATSYRLVIRQTKQRLHRDLPETTVWGIDDGTGTSFPGPMIEARTGEEIDIAWVNDLRNDRGFPRTDHPLPVSECPTGSADEPRVLPLIHGLIAPDAVEADTFILPGEQIVQRLTVAQPAAMLWYRDRAQGMSRLNQYMGLTGLFVLRDSIEDELGLPGGERELFLVIHDRTFTPEGELYYPEEPTEHFFGNTVLVNGVAWPYVAVAPARYRVRILNAANARTLQLSLSNGHPFLLIGSDQGLFSERRLVESVTLAPGERVDLGVTFRPFLGNSFFLVNSAPAPFPGNGGVVRDVLRFDVGTVTPNPIAIPAALRAIEAPDPSTASTTRDFVLRPRDDACGGRAWMFDGDGESATDLEIPIQSTEIWRLVNRSGLAHPIHVGGTAMKVLDRQGIETSGDDFVLVGEPEEPATEEQGIKDTVLVGANEAVRVLVHFGSNVGRYVIQSLNLEAGDNELLRSFKTFSECGDGLVGVPTEACDDGNQVDGDGCSSECTVEEPEPPAAPEEDAGGCTVGPRGSTNILLLALAGGLGYARRRRRSSRSTSAR